MDNFKGCYEGQYSELSESASSGDSWEDCRFFFARQGGTGERDGDTPRGIGRGGRMCWPFCTASEHLHKGSKRCLPPTVNGVERGESRFRALALQVEPHLNCSTQSGNDGFVKFCHASAKDTDCWNNYVGAFHQTRGKGGEKEKTLKAGCGGEQCEDGVPLQGDTVQQYQHTLLPQIHVSLYL